MDLSPLYFVTLGICALAFVLKFQLKKPGMKAILAMVGIGVIEAALMIVALILAN